MKLYFVVLFAVLLVISSKSQEHTFLQVDSLRQELVKAKHDTSRIFLITKLGEAFRSTRPDTALLLANKALALAKKVRYKKGEINALLLLSVLQREQGNLPYSLQLAFSALRIAQEQHILYEEALSYLRIANTYSAAKNFSRCLFYLKEADAKLARVPDLFVWSVIHMVKADVYTQLNQLDSAAFELNLIKVKNPSFAAGYQSYGYLMIFGDLELKKGNSSLALSYFKESVKQALNDSNYRFAGSGFTRLASLYKKLSKIDSAVYYAKQGLAYGVLLKYQNRILAPSLLLAELYEPVNVSEALRYYKIASAAKDSLYGAEKVQKLQSMTMEEQERQRVAEAERLAYENKMRQMAFIAGLVLFFIVAIILFRNNRQKQRAYELLKVQKAETDQQKAKAEKALEDLKATQAQLVQREKMASLGELTAGVAHEIQNPLNFVNNFSEVNRELIEELKSELQVNNNEQALTITDDIKENELKIALHGKRADAIVKSMLEHCRTSKGEKLPTNINALVDEYLRLSYHGAKARDKNFTAIVETHLDASIGKIEVIPQDIGRVLLNLFNNAFYAVNEKKMISGNGYEPVVQVSTKRVGERVEIKVRDNGTGIPEKMLEKIYQPFFTTKPTGQGTGLGLSLSYGIVTKGHGGELRVETKGGEGAEFIITLPFPKSEEDTAAI